MTDLTMTTATGMEYDPENPPPVGTAEHALWLVHLHFAWENPDRIDRLADLYHDDIVWEVPTRQVLYRGKKEVIANYRRVFESAEGLELRPVDQYATPDRVFDDSEAYFTLTSSAGFPNHPLPVGTKVAMRLIHSFHIAGGLITRENGYEIWRPDTRS
jgi:ketosteroid isomerase-like protein